MSITRIDRALNAVVVAYAADSGLQHVPEAAPPSDKQMSSPWLQSRQLYGSIERVTQGQGATDVHSGTLQIDVSDRPGIGKGRVIETLDELRGEYNGKTLQCDGQTVHVDAVSITPVRAADGWIRASAQVRWRAYDVIN